LLDLVLGVGIGKGDGGDQALFAVDGVALELENVAVSLTVSIVLAEERRCVVALEELAVLGDALVKPVAVNRKLFATVDKAGSLSQEHPADETPTGILWLWREAGECEDKS
jgi:hypothetical protein